MKRRITTFWVGLAVMAAAQSYAANGDLLVNGKIGVGVATTPLAKLTIYDSGTFNPTQSYQTKTITMGNIDVNGWRATGMCSGHSDAGAPPVCMAANTGIWYFGFQNSPTTMFTTAYLTSIGNLVLAGNVYQYSDGDLKKDVQDISDSLARVKELRSVYFKWNDEKWSQNRQLGVIAEEVERVFPELVMEVDHPSCTASTDCAQPKVKVVDYPKLSVIALQGVRELSDKMEKLEKRLDILEKKLSY